MAGPIYKMFYARWTEAWYALSSEQRDAIFQQITATTERLGVKSVLICDSSWASDKWLFWAWRNTRIWQPFRNTPSVSSS